MSICAQVFVWVYVFILLVIYLKVGLPRDRVCICLALIDIDKVFSKVVEPIHAPTSNVQHRGLSHP